MATKPKSKRKTSPEIRILVDKDWHALFLSDPVSAVQSLHVTLSKADIARIRREATKIVKQGKRELALLKPMHLPIISGGGQGGGGDADD